MHEADPTQDAMTRESVPNHLRLEGHLRLTTTCKQQLVVGYKIQHADRHGFGVRLMKIVNIDEKKMT